MHDAYDAGTDVDSPCTPRTAPAATGGLTAAEVAERVARGQVNDVPVRTAGSVTEIVRANVFTRFNAIIGVLWVIMLFVAPIQDSLFGFVILANTGIGIVQEWRAKKTLDCARGDRRGPADRAAGRGRPPRSPPPRSCSDDLIELGPGDKAVVDGVCVEADGLEIDESLLTGEADPVVKRPGDPVMSGSFVGRRAAAPFTATKVGREAYAAQLAEEASRFTLVHSELRSGISTILKYVTWMMVPAAIGLIISQLVVKDNDFEDSVARTVGGIVPMVPEGLVLLTSVAFAIGVIRLGRKQCLVQELPAIEGLARVDTVCLDKTGTLTEGGMDVTELRPLDGADEDVRTAGAGRPRRVRSPAQRQPPGHHRRLPGRRGLARAPQALPFSSARKYSGAAFTEGDGEAAAWLLGAPDVLLAPDDPALAETGRLNEQGLRVLLLARARPRPGRPDAAAPGPAHRARRPGAAAAARRRATRCATSPTRTSRRRSSPATTRSRSARWPQKLGTWCRHAGGRPPAARRTATEMATALDDGPRSSAGSPRSRSGTWSGALQSRGHTVAMTGDGVNDVLALKDADIGVSMGSGSEATRAVAQIVLLNNSFATLPSVVAEGRRVIGNITRVATLFLVEDRLLGAAGAAGGVLAGGVPVPAAPSDAAVHADHRRPGVLPGARPQQGAGPAALRTPGHAVRDPRRGDRGGGDLRDVSARPPPLHRRGRAGRGDQRGDPDAVPDLHVGPGDHRPPLHLVAGRPGGRDGPGLPASCWRCPGSRTSSR